MAIAVRRRIESSIRVRPIQSIKLDDHGNKLMRLKHYDEALAAFRDSFWQNSPTISAR